jgi:hypothetical protein
LTTLPLTQSPSDLIDKAAQWLVESENPIFVVGSQVGLEGAHGEIVALAEKLSVPVVETMHSLYANFPNDHPLFLGELALVAREDFLDRRASGSALRRTVREGPGICPCRRGSRRWPCRARAPAHRRRRGSEIAMTGRRA